jgi:hypothetical protein
MIRFSEFLQESLGLPYPVEKLNHNKELINYSFKVDDITYTVDFLLWPDMERFTIWFSANNSMKKLGNPKTSIRIFSTVAQLAARTHRRFPSYTIEFSADTDEPSRVKLYDRLANMVVEKTGGKLRTNFHKKDKKYYIEMPK